MAFKDYSDNPASNTTIGDSTFVGPNMPRDNVRPAIQQLAADGRDLYDTVIAMGSDGTLPQFIASGTGAVVRGNQAKLRELGVSVTDYGADPTGVADSTLAFQRAASANVGVEIYIPPGTYELGNVGWLHFAGQRWRGASKYQTILKAKPGTTGAIFSNTASATASSAYIGFEGVRFDLNGEFCTAIDLSSINNSTVRDCYFSGGMGFGAAATTSGSPVVTLTGLNGESTTRVKVGQKVFGPLIPLGTTVLSVSDSTHFTMSASATGTSASTQVYCVAGTAVRLAAPLNAASYTNNIQDCAGLNLDQAFVAEDAANENTFNNVEAVACAAGFSIENGVDTARIIGGRVEGCLVGLTTGGRETMAIGVRFENNFTADVSLLAGSERPSFLSCYTATSATTFLNESNCTGLFSRGGSFPQRDYEPNVSNPRIQAGRTTFGAASSAAGFQADLTTALPGSLTTYAGYFHDPLFLRNAAGTIEGVNATKDNTVLMLSVDASNRVSLSGYDRKAGVFNRLYLGEHFSLNGAGLEYDGVKVLGTRQTAVGDAANAAAAPTQAEFNALVAKFNLLLDKLGTAGHGLTAD